MFPHCGCRTDRSESLTPDKLSRTETSCRSISNDHIYAPNLFTRGPTDAEQTHQMSEKRAIHPQPALMVSSSPSPHPHHRTLLTIPVPQHHRLRPRRPDCRRWHHGLRARRLYSVPRGGLQRWGIVCSGRLPHLEPTDVRRRTRAPRQPRACRLERAACIEDTEAIAHWAERAGGVGAVELRDGICE